MKILSDKNTVLLISLLFTLYSCGGEDIVKNSDDPEEIIDGTLERFVPDGYTKTWEDHFDGTEINTAHWTVGSLRDPDTGDIVPGADGDHLLKTKYSGYVTKEDSYLEDGALVLRNQKGPLQGQALRAITVTLVVG